MIVQLLLLQHLAQYWFCAKLEELSYRQISDITDLPIGTVLSRLARARRAFGDAWRRETDDGA